MALLTEDLVDQAVELSLPTMREVARKNTWGPKGVAIAVNAKGLDQPYLAVMDELGPMREWEEKWGEGRRFDLIALSKAHIARSNGTTSWEVVSQMPWLLEEGDFLYRGGVAEDTDLGVGVSGIYGEMDEALAWIVWNLIAGLCNLEITMLRKDKVNRLP